MEVANFPKVWQHLCVRAQQNLEISVTYSFVPRSKSWIPKRDKEKGEGMSTLDRTKTMVETKTLKPALLSRNWLLSHLSCEELENLARYALFRDFKHKESIFRKGEAGHSMLIVVDGCVQITNHAVSGREVVLNIMNPGDIVGEIALLDGGERTADAIAVGNVRLLELARRDFLPFLERHSDVSIKLLTLLCRRVRKTSDQIEDFVFLDPPGRLAKTLLRLAKLNQTSVDEPKKPCVDLQLSQTEIGALAGMRREAVNRQLHQWQDMGIVSLDHRRIWIDQPGSLEEIGEGFV